MSKYLVKLKPFIIIDRICLSGNPNAVHILEQEQYRIDWFDLSQNPNAIHILEKNLDKVDWVHLSANPNAIHILEKNLDKVSWRFLSYNLNAIGLLEKNLDKINWGFLSINPNAIGLLMKNPDKIYWNLLSANTSAIYLLEKYRDKIDWDWLSLNPNAIHLLKKNLDKINWHWLSQNPNAIRILEKNPNKIDWKGLSLNPNAIRILEKNPDKIDWSNLSLNPNAMHLLEKNLDKINWYLLSYNPNIFEYDYQVERSILAELDELENLKRLESEELEENLKRLESGDFSDAEHDDAEIANNFHLRQRRMRILCQKYAVVLKRVSDLAGTEAPIEVPTRGRSISRPATKAWAARVQDHMKQLGYDPNRVNERLRFRAMRRLLEAARKSHNKSAAESVYPKFFPSIMTPRLSKRPSVVVASSDEADANTKPVPYVIKWRHGGGNCVLLGSFNNWERMSMVKNQEDFTATVDLLPGRYEIKFVVDNEWRFCPDMHKTLDVFGNVNNVLFARILLPGVAPGAPGEGSSKPQIGMH